LAKMAIEKKELADAFWPKLTTVGHPLRSGPMQQRILAT